MVRSLSGCALLVVLLGAFAACEGQRPPAVAAPAPVTTVARPTVTFETPSGAISVAVDVARTPAQRSQGLMYVEHLPSDRGMVFLMGPERVQTFWMKNTFIPLDMIFVNDAYEVVGVVAEAEPHTTTPRRVERASSYVVEVNGGWAKAHGVAAGTRVRFSAIE